MVRGGFHRHRTASLPLVLLLLFAAASVRAAASAEESRAIEAWRAARAQSLTSPTGWLSLAGLYWLQPGANSFGSGPKSVLRLQHPSLARRAGVFTLEGSTVRFDASPGRPVTLEGKRVDHQIMVPDSAGEPTVLATGTLKFFVIERAGRYGVRVRDLQSARRTEFRGLDYFPVDDAWAVDARFEPYEPAKVIPIMNILGMEVPMTSPGALVFERDGREWRLDAVLEEPDAPDLFIMFADGTSGRETYGGGRFLTAPRATDGRVRLDFNRAYNPPCAFNTFATCPLPPDENRLTLRVTAGEMKYAGAAH